LTRSSGLFRRRVEGAMVECAREAGVVAVGVR
jgi:hypothetical protein